MVEMIRRVIPVLVVTLGALAPQSQAQELRELKAAPARWMLSMCGASIEPPATLPPSNSGPVVYKLAPCFERQGGIARVRADAYLRDINLRPSRPFDGLWIPYDAAAERMILDDFQRLWKSHALADLSIEVHDYMFSNGVIGKLVTYHITERAAGQ